MIRPSSEGPAEGPAPEPARILGRIGGRCKFCGKEVGPLRSADGKLPTRSASLTGMDPDGLFCTLRCAARYGVRAARGR